MYIITRFAPAALTDMLQDRDFIKLSNAPAKVSMYPIDLPYEPATSRLCDSIIAAFREVEQKMPYELAQCLKVAVKLTMKTTTTTGCISKTKVSAMMPYQKLAGKYGIEKQLCYPDWFFMAAWLGPGHPFLEDIRKDMSDVWGVEFPTDEIIYPMIVDRKTEDKLFMGEVAPTPKGDSIEERAKTIKKTINESSVNSLSAAIKDHLPDAFKNFSDASKVHTLENSLASTNRELEDARKKANNLEKQLIETKAAQEKTSRDMDTLRKEIKQLNAAHGSTENVKKVVEALRVALRQQVTGIEAKVEKDMRTLRNEVAESAEKAEKAVETGALVLSVLSTPGGQKRKMDEIS
jgi:hypothetical protein